MGNVFNLIGNFFNKRGNTVGKIMTATGTTAMGVAGMGMIHHAMKSDRSIFGSHGCMPFGAMGTMGVGGYCIPGMAMGEMNPMSTMGGYNLGGCSIFGGMNPMMMGGMNPMSMMGMMGMGGVNPMMMGGMNMFGMGGIGNSAMNPFGFLNQNSNFNFNIGSSSSSSSTEIDLDEQKRLDKQKYQKAELSEDGDKTKGKEFDKKMNEMAAGNRSSIEIEGEDGSDYKAAISSAGKNYIKGIDTDNDGLISEDEFVKHEAAGKFSNLDNANDIAKVAFRKIDQNQDGYIDWKEMSATFAAFDASSSRDGKITESEYKTQSELMTKHKDLKFDNALKDNYEKYFGNNDESS